MQEVVGAVLEVAKDNYGYLTGKDVSTVVTSKDFNGSKGGNGALWKRIHGDTMPGTGLSPADLIRDLTRSTANNIVKLIKQAYVEKFSLADLLARIRGTAKLGYKDGLLNKLNNQWRTALNTIMANIKSWLADKIGSLFYDTYQWISTIDSVTTQICRHRHLMIYRYGEGTATTGPL
jgi:hypothetical protein